MDKYINLFTDFGFKKVFGEEPNKDLLISFLNTLLPARHQIASLEYSRNKWLGNSALDRKAIFDLHCKAPDGTYFLVELQKAKQNYFKDRSVYYSSFPIQEQGQQGDWDFKLQAVYTIGVLDFRFDDADKDDVVHTVQLKNQKNQVFYDKLTFIYITLPNFSKPLRALETLQDKWFYVFRHLPGMDAIPPELQEDTFRKLFQIAEMAAFKPQERDAYQASLKYYRDLKNVIDTAFGDGEEKGRVTERAIAKQELAEVRAIADRKVAEEVAKRQLVEEEAKRKLAEMAAAAHQKQLDFARTLKGMGWDDQKIAGLTGLGLAEIADI